MKINLSNLNGWQRLFVLFSLIWLVIFLSFAHDLPPSYRDLTGGFSKDVISGRMSEYMPKKSFDPDKYITDKSSIKARAIVSSPEYQKANQGTKQAIFEQLVATDKNYINADKVTQKAIRDRFGIEDNPAWMYDKQKSIVDPTIVNNVVALAASKNVPPDDLVNVYTSPNGVVFESAYHSKEEMAKAYAEAIKSLDRDYILDVVKSIAYKIFVYILSITFMYLVGWLIAWVIKGFRK